MTQKPDSSFALPLHEQVARQLQRDIVEQGLAVHSKIPSEVDLARRHGVSRGTVIKAVNTLVQQGVLYRRRPQGTFVAPPADPETTTPTRASGPDAHAEPGTIGLIMPYLSDSFLGNIVTGIETFTRTLGYSLSFACSDNDWALERHHLDQFMQRGVSGVLLFPCEPHRSQAAALQQLQEHHIPFVLIDRYIPDFPCDYVVSDDLTAGYMATQHLVSLGHRRIGYVSLKAPITSSTERYKGYVRCLEEYGMLLDESISKCELQQSSPASMPSGIPVPESGQSDRSLLRTYLLQPERPEAIVTTNDYVALRILQVAEELGLEVPQQLALVSCGGSELGIHARVPLTAVMQAPNDIGRQAAHLLHDHITHTPSGIHHIIVPVTLAIRRSCGAIQPRLVVDPATSGHSRLP